MTKLQIPDTNIDEFIIQFAREHGIKYTRTSADAMAEVITRLSGDEVPQDDIADLLVALKRANVIDGRTMIELLGRHIDECGHE